MKTNTITLTNKELKLLNSILDFLLDNYVEDHLPSNLDKYIKIFNKLERKEIAQDIYSQNQDIYEDYKLTENDLDDFNIIDWLKKRIEAQTD